MATNKEKTYKLEKEIEYLGRLGELDRFNYEQTNVKYIGVLAVFATLWGILINSGQGLLGALLFGAVTIIASYWADQENKKHNKHWITREEIIKSRYKELGIDKDKLYEEFKKIYNSKAVVKYPVKKLDKVFDYLSKALFFIIIIILAIGIFNGSAKLLTFEFLKYLITLAFLLGGMTFIVFVYNHQDDFKSRIAESCQAFILSGFFLLAYLCIANIGSTENTLLGVLIAYNSLIGLLGLIILLIGLILLVWSIYLEVEYNSKHKTKK